MPDEKTIEAGWQSFWDASKITYDEHTESHMRDAFFCGAFYMMKTMGSLTSHVIGDAPKIEALKQELQDFYDEELSQRN